MEAVKDAVWSLFCASLVAAVVSELGGGAKAGRRLLCGVFLAAVLLSKLGAIELSALSVELGQTYARAERYAAEGEEQAAQMKFSLISDSCEAYILDKAEELGASVTVSVTLDPEGGLPESVTLEGTLTPLQRQKLIGEITTALGLEKEAVVWTP